MIHFVAFGIFGIFFPFWYVVPRKIWQPCWVGEELGVADQKIVQTLSTKKFVQFFSFDIRNPTLEGCAVRA
jgi:hypothetical protein